MEIDLLSHPVHGSEMHGIVGLTGAPASGKSTTVEDLSSALAARGLLAGSVQMGGCHLSNAVIDAWDVTAAREHRTPSMPPVPSPRWTARGP